MADAKFPEGRKLLALYPVFLFYLSLAWIVLIGFQQGTTKSGTVTEVNPGTDSPTKSPGPVSEGSASSESGGSRLVNWN